MTHNRHRGICTMHGYVWRANLVGESLAALVGL
jgi:hypothetical protein